MVVEVVVVAIAAVLEAMRSHDLPDARPLIKVVAPWEPTNLVPKSCPKADVGLALPRAIIGVAERVAVAALVLAVWVGLHRLHRFSTRCRRQRGGRNPHEGPQPLELLGWLSSEVL
eukprot:COSAG01_NODE_929_length_12669_cov_12.073865_17_plen_116_part_00